jgi:uncharacterized protein YbdZ (MbtH family)
VSINPFDDDNGNFFVLVNEEEQHSRGRPSPMFQPAGGWFTAKGIALRCLDYIEQNWPDIRPKRLRERLAAGQAFDK